MKNFPILFGHRLRLKLSKINHSQRNFVIVEFEKKGLIKCETFSLLAILCHAGLVERSLHGRWLLGCRQNPHKEVLRVNCLHGT
jgi:hypothetical protein